MLVMITYCLRVLPLFRELQEAHTKVIQPWYEDYTGVGRNFSFILAHLDKIMVWGPPRGHFTYPTKSILVVPDPNIVREERFFRGQVLTIVTGSQYMGSNIGYAAPQSQ